MKSESKSAPRSKLDAKLTSTNLLSRQQRLSIARNILSLSGLLSCVDAFSEGRGLGTRREEDPGWPLVAEAQSLPSILSRNRSMVRFPRLETFSRTLSWLYRALCHVAQ